MSNPLNEQQQQQQQQQIQQAQADLASLSRVSHRLALIDTTQQLQSVLDKLLPRLLFRIGDNHQAQLRLARQQQQQHATNEDTALQRLLTDTLSKIHGKLVEILSHTMKRVRDDSTCQLPCLGILNLFLTERPKSQSSESSELPPQAKTLSEIDPFTMNLSLAFLTLGIPRITPCSSSKAKENNSGDDLLPGILALLSRFTESTQAIVQLHDSLSLQNQWQQVTHLFLASLERVIQREEDELAKHSFQSRLSQSSSKRPKVVSNSKDKRESDDVTPSTSSSLDHLRSLLQQNSIQAQACYDLFLDVLLYQTMASSNRTTTAASTSTSPSAATLSLPPPGLAPRNYQRLIQGHSNKARDWAAEMAPRSRLAEIKVRLLDWIAPSRQWAIFLGVQVQGEGRSNPRMGLARSLTLLMAAAGDPSPEVADRAKTYLKQYLEGNRKTSTETNTDEEQKDADVLLYGSPLAILTQVLTLSVGANNAQLLMSSSSSAIESLGLSFSVSSNGASNQQAIMAFRRRIVSETTFATLATYSAKILDEVPHLGKADGASDLVQVGTLAIAACSKFLSQLRTSSGLTMLRGKHYVAAAQLLNALVVRLTSILQSSSQDVASKNSQNRQALITLLGKAMTIACQSLSTVSGSNVRASSNNPNTSVQTAAAVATGSEANVAVRDALYGVISTLSRCQSLPSGERTWLFALGQQGENKTTNTGIVLSTETVTLLFGCVNGEVESLRPRAVAALDALLASYCRILDLETIQEDEEAENSNDAPKNVSTDIGNATEANPWGAMTPSSPSDVDEPMELEDIPSLVDKVDSKELAKQLVPLLWKASQPVQPKQSRVSAARWSSDLMMQLDTIDASHILCCLAGDSDVTASNIARKGLGLRDMSTESSETNNKKKSLSLGVNDSDDGARTPADFDSLVPVLFSDEIANSGWRPSFWEFSAKGKAATVEYVLRCLLDDIYGGDEEDSMKLFLASICKTVLEAVEEGRPYLGLLEECSSALAICLSTSSFARSLIVSKSTTLDAEDISKLALTANSSRSRRLLAEAWGALFTDILLWENVEWLKSVETALKACSAIIEGQGSLGHKHGSAFMAGTCIRVLRQHSTLKAPESVYNLASSLFLSMGSKILDSDDSIGNAFTDGVAIASTYSTDDAPLLELFLVPGATNILLKLAEALKKFGNGDNVDVPRVFKLTKAAGQVLAFSTALHDGKSDSSLNDSRMLCVDALLLMLGSNSYRKDEEVALCTGEALHAYADAYSPENVTWSNRNDNWPTQLDLEFSKTLPPHQKVLYIMLRRVKLENNPHKRTSCGPALFAIVAGAAKKINLNYSSRGRCLALELGRCLADIQECFIKLLGDPKSKHLCRESCCLGLTACRTLAKVSRIRDAGEELNNRLLRAFGQTTNHGGSAMQETQQQAAERRLAESSGTIQAETTGVEAMSAEVGGASGIAEASLGAYREMASASISIGRPDILYALLMLSVSNPAWQSPERDYGPTALLGNESILGKESAAAEMREALKGHIGKLLPRILRGCHSPNKEAREQMESLWVGLTGGGAEARATITKHLLLTIDTLIEDSSSKLWRTRLGACGALYQVIVGRSWSELGGGPAVLFDDDVSLKATPEATSAGVRLLRLWWVAMRSIDDVRVNVREAGESLGRGVRSLTLRLVDPNSLRDEQTAATEITKHRHYASAAAATSLRWLIKHGLNQKCAEAAGVCISCLVGIVDVASPSILQPLIPDLLRALLMAMSSLEPAAFSYLQVRAAGQAGGTGESYDSLERLRLQVAQTGPLAEAVSKCLEMVPKISLSTQKAVIPELNSAIRMSAGITTRTAAADCVSTLCSSCPDAFRNGSNGALNPSVSLLRALYTASERERGQAARDKYAHACGNLAALCPGSSVRSLAMKAAERYNASTGSNDDPAARKAAAITLRAIAVKAANQFSDGGNSDIWCRRVLPIAFLGMRDSDVKVARLFSDVWEEGGSAANMAGAADGFGNLLEEKLLVSIVKECNKALRDVSWSRRVTGSNALGELARKNILSPPPRSSSGPIRNLSTEASLRAKKRAESSKEALVALVKLIAETRMWSGKQHIFQAMATLASKWASTLANSEDSLSSVGLSQDGVPITLTSDSDDLFLHDEWFQVSSKNHVLLDEIKQESAGESAMEVDDVNTTGNLDFGESDFQDGEAGEAEPLQNAETEKVQSPPTFTGICRLLLDQAFPTKKNTLSVTEEEILPFRSAVLKSYSDLLRSLDDCVNGAPQKQLVFQHMAKQLRPVFDIEISDSTESPLIVSRSIDAYAASFWEGFGSSDAGENVLQLAELFLKNSEQGRPWTVKVSSLMGCARMVQLMDKGCLRSPICVSKMVQLVSVGLKDRKFWKVRLASLELLEALVARAGRKTDTGSNEGQLLVLESLLPHKERMIQLAKATLVDSEAKVTALASNILSSMAWWP